MEIKITINKESFHSSKMAWGLGAALLAISLGAYAVTNTFTANTVISASAVNQNFAELEAAIASAVPAGAVMSFARSTCPAGWLKANGAQVSRTTYFDLYAAVGSTFGNGDGSSTFHLPDLRGEFVRGWDDGRGIDATRSLGTAQADEFRSHSHGQPPNGWWVSAPFSGDGPFDSSGTTGPLEHTRISANTQTAGGAETRPRNIALLYCIKI